MCDENKNFLNKLPLCIIEKILIQLDYMSLIEFSMINKEAKMICANEIIWCKIYKNEFDLNRICEKCNNKNNKILKNYKNECIKKFKIYNLIENLLDINIETVNELGDIKKVCFVHDNTMIYTGTVPLLKIHINGKKYNHINITTPHKLTITCILYTNYGIVSSSVDGIISIWKIKQNDLNVESLCSILIQHRKSINCLSNFDNILVSGSEDHTACIVDLTTMTLIESINYGRGVRCTSINSKWIVIGGVHGSIILLNRNLNEKSTLICDCSSYCLVNLTLKNDVLISISRNEMMHIWDLNEAKIKYSCRIHTSSKMYFSGINFVLNDFVLINDEITGIKMICLKHFTHIHTFSHNNIKILCFTVIYDKYMILIDKNYEVSLWDIIKRNKIKKYFTIIYPSKHPPNIHMNLIETNQLVILTTHSYPYIQNCIYTLKFTNSQNYKSII